MSRLNRMTTYAEISERSTNLDLVAMSTPLHIAAVNGEKSTIELLLKNTSPEGYQCDVDEGDKFHRTALVYTVFGDWYECAEVLLRHKASLDKEDRDKRTALHWATYLGKPKFVNLFLQHIDRRQNWNVCDLEGRTPLHYAAAQESSKCLRLLLKRIPADKIDTTDGEKKTALHWSAYYGYLENVKLLLKAGATKSMRDMQQNSLLHLAVANPQSRDAVRITRVLLKLNPYFSNQSNYKRRTPLHLAVANENEELVRELTSKRALDMVDELSRSALHYAVLRNNENILRILISSGASLYTVDSTGATALHYAAKNNNSELVAVLLVNRKLEDIPDNEGRTALMWAASEDSVYVLDLMLGYATRFNVHACDKEGLTALHYACIAGNERCVTLLISNSPDVSQLDNLGQTPLFKACQQGHLDVVNILMGNKRGGVGRRAVTVVDRDGIMRDNDERDETLGEHHGDHTGGYDHSRGLLVNSESNYSPNREWRDQDDRDGAEHQCTSNDVLQSSCPSNGNFSKATRDGRKPSESIACSGLSDSQRECIQNLEDHNGCTPLHFAAHAGHADVCLWLLHNGVEPGKKDSRGRIALHSAAFNGHTSSMDAMLSCQAELMNERDKDGNCALHWAAKNGHLEAVKTLVLKYGAFPNYRVTSSNLTPLDLAIAAAQQDVTQFLIDHGALTIAGVQEVACYTIKRYIRKWLAKRERKSMEPLLLKHSWMLTQDDSSKGITSDVINANHIPERQDQPDMMTFPFQDKPQEPGIMAVEETPVDKCELGEQLSNNQDESSSMVCQSSKCLNALRPPKEASSFSNPLCFAGDVDQTRLVDASSSDLPFFDESNQNSLFEQSRLGHLDVIDSLIAAGADVNSRDENGCTPLHVAAIHGREAACERLLEQGADPKKRNVLGKTALHHASLNGHSACIGLLLAKEPDVVFSLDRDNTSALHCAASSGHLEAVKLLLQTYNAQPNVHTISKNLTALDYAIIGNHRKVVKFLTEHGAETSGVLESAVSVINRNVRVWLIRKRIRVSPTQQSVGDTTNKHVINESDCVDVIGNDFGQNSEVVLEIKRASDFCGQGLHMESNFAPPAPDCVAGRFKHLPEPPKEGKRNRSIFQEKHPRAPDCVVLASEKERILKLRRDWERIAVVRTKMHAAAVIQRRFRQHLQQKGVKVNDAGKNTSKGNGGSTCEENKKLFASSQTQRARKLKVNRSQAVIPSSTLFSERGKMEKTEKEKTGKRDEKQEKMEMKDKEKFKSCFPSLLQTISASSSTKSPTKCSATFPRDEDTTDFTCKPVLTTDEKVEQWLHKGTAKGERVKTPSNTPRWQNTRKTTDSNKRVFLKSHSLPEGSRNDQRIVPNRPKTTNSLRSRSVQYLTPRTPMSTGHSPLARESLIKSAYASPAAISYNFALDTYHPLASRRGCKQAQFPLKTSTRVRPNSMRRGINGWVHTNRFAEAMASSNSSVDSR